MVTSMRNLVTTLKDRFLASGVRSLKDFGYENVSAGNILTDEIYKAFFKSLLVEALRETPTNSKAAEVIRGLLKEVSDVP